jgi:hypothetical protein
MAMERDSIVMDYLQTEIEKMQKTVEGLDKMIKSKDPQKDNDLIKSLRDIRLTTLKNIEDKKRKLKCLYNNKIESDHN